MKINGKVTKAIIFDLDGTLIDSNNVWKKVDEDFFAKRNRNIPKDYTKSISHIGLYEAARITIDKFNVQGDIESILKEWKDSAYDMYANKIMLKPYVKDFLEKAKKEGIILTIATACDKDLYLPCLKNRGIYNYFKLIADVEQTKCDKSSSKIYQYISAKINIPIENTIVIEDISIGLKSAYECGYITIGIHDDFFTFDDEEKKKYSTLYINSFKELLDY